MHTFEMITRVHKISQMTLQGASIYFDYGPNFLQFFFFIRPDVRTGNFSSLISPKKTKLSSTDSEVFANLVYKSNGNGEYGNTYPQPGATKSDSEQGTYNRIPRYATNS